MPQEKLRILTIPLHALTVPKIEEMSYLHPTIRIYLNQDNFVEGILEKVIFDSGEILLKNVTHFYCAIRMFHTHSSINVVFNEITKFEILTRNEYKEFVKYLTTDVHPTNLYSQSHSTLYQVSPGGTASFTEEISYTAVAQTTDQNPVNNSD